MIVLSIALSIGVASYLASGTTPPSRSTNGGTPGWVYFVSPYAGAVQSPPDPIKVGFTHRDPFKRLPEIETMSPRRLELIDAIYCPFPEELEKFVHEQLDRFRLHGEWFDRDVTLSWLDDFKSKLQ